ncbi:MAG: ABC transporter ATP-binding protein [Firmicutes bacterium]|nr:ABC transporter ATP-binding protein [Bacillota bacterium]
MTVTTNKVIMDDSYMENNILVLKDLKQHFPVGRNSFVRAVDGVNLNAQKGEVLGVVGESGSGKSTIAYTIMGMYKPTGGQIIFDGEDAGSNTSKRSMKFKRNVQIVFQDPGSSLNPFQDVRQILSLPLRVHKIVPKQQIDKKILEILEMVELPKSFLYKSPNSIGGGEKQLVSIARALCSDPKFIILDEPTSSLDVSIQAKIINMLLTIHKERRLTYLLITHDLSLMRNISDRVAIMYLGKICEVAPTEMFYSSPMHPYTQMLLSSIPVISEEEEALKPKKVLSVGEIPSPVNIPKGCSFNTRCSQKMDICFKKDPCFHEVSSGHLVRCHLFNENNNKA